MRPSRSYPMRVLTYLYGLGWFGLLCVLCLPLSLGMLLLPSSWRPRAAQFMRAVMLQAFSVIRWHCHLTGFVTMRLVDHRPPELAGSWDGVVLLANHLTMFDIVLLFGCIPQLQTLVNAKFLANPLMAPTIRACGYIPLRVGSASHGVAAFAELQAAAARGEPLVLFPEGTRSVSGELGPLSRGAFRLASSAVAPPCFVFFTCNQPFLNRAAFFPKRPGPVILEAHVMPPVARDAAGAVPSSEALQALFTEQYAAFQRSALVLAWNAPLNRQDSDDRARATPNDFTQHACDRAGSS